MTTVPSARPASSTFGLSDSPSSNSSLFLSLSGAASPFSSNVSCGNYSLSNSTLSESPRTQQHLQHQHQHHQCSQQQQQQLQCATAADDWQLQFLQQQDAQDSQLQEDQLPHSDASIWGSLDLTRSDDADKQGPVAFDAFSADSACGFSVWPQMLADGQGDSLHNRIFERGENYFGFSQEDRQLLESVIKQQPQQQHQQQQQQQQEEQQLLLTHFPRRKLDADPRVPATVYLDDKSGRRQLTLDVTCGQPVSKLLVRSHAIGLAPGECLQPCPKCSERNCRLLVSILSHSLEGLVHADPDRQQSCLYVTGQPEAGQMWLTLRYNCSQDHLRNSYRLGHLALANLLTIVEAYDQLGCLIGRASYRVRIVASPARDLLRFLTNQLTPDQTGCTLGQCAHLAARWKAEKFRHLPPSDLRLCLARYRFKDDLRCELEALLESPAVSKSSAAAAAAAAAAAVAVAVKRQFPEEAASGNSNCQDGSIIIRTSAAAAATSGQASVDLKTVAATTAEVPGGGVGDVLRQLPDGSLLIRVADSARMAKIRRAIVAAMAEDAVVLPPPPLPPPPPPPPQLPPQSLVVPIMAQHQQPAVAQPAQATAQIILSPQQSLHLQAQQQMQHQQAFQPILLIRPYCQYAG